MHTETLNMGSGLVKHRHIIGGATAQAIYERGGLADRLRAYRHNTADKGQPPMNEDGTRTYRLVESRDSSCDGKDKEVVTYSGKRFVVRDGEQVEAWEVCRNGEPFLGNRGQRTGYAWGTSQPTTVAAFSLAVDILEDVDGHVQHTLDLSGRIISNLPDFWHLTGNEILAFIDALESQEVSCG